MYKRIFPGRRLREADALERLGEKVNYGFWEKYDDGHTVIRFATDWGTAIDKPAKGGYNAVSTKKLKFGTLVIDRGYNIEVQE